jgi:precorrin-3B C17-methyltransferase
MSAMPAPAGSLIVVGLGPGDPRLTTPEAADALNRATDIVGYDTYVRRVPDRPGLVKHASDNRVEVERARHALELAEAGRDVVVVSSGDPGVFAMAAAVMEAVEADPARFAGLDIRVVPGISAMFAAAARLGAPLGHDFCAINLSDNLKPWDVIEKRLRLAAEADFVIALYNPLSKARPTQLGSAFEVLRALKAPETPVMFASAVSDASERIDVVPLGDADPARADMRTLVMIGSSKTRLIARPSGRPFVHTPRFWR